MTSTISMATSPFTTSLYDINVTDYDYDGSELEGNFTIAPTIEAFFDGDLMLHPFWMRYRDMIEDIPPIVHYILGIFIAIVGFIGISGNVLVIYMFTVNKSLRTPSNLFIINLAISDLGFSAVNGFPLMTISCFMRKWYFGKIACEFYAFMGGLFGFNSINSLAWISYDRMFVISKPFEAMRKSTMKRSALQLIIVWAWALIWSVPPLVGWGAYIPEGFMTSCSFDYLTRDTLNQTYVWSMFAGGFVAPVLMIIYCYMIIIKAVTSQAKMMNKTAEKMGAKVAKDEKAKKQEIALAKVAAVTILFFMLSWLPYAFVSLAAMAGFDAILTPYTCVIPVMFAKASAMWNPILYALSHPRFRAALDELFPALVLCRGLCMDKGGDDDKETSDDGQNKDKKKPAVEESSMSEVSEVYDSSTVVETTRVETSPAPTRQQRGGGQSQGRSTQQHTNSHHPPHRQLQPQEPRVAPGSNHYDYREPQDREPQPRRRSFRASIGRAAGEAYKSLIDAYVGLKNVTDKLADKRTQMTLEEHHPAVSRKSSTVGYENPTYQPNMGAGVGLPTGVPTGIPQVQVQSGAYPPGVYSVPMMYQQNTVPQTQYIGYSAPYQGGAPPMQFVQLPVGASIIQGPMPSPPSSPTLSHVSHLSPSTTPPSVTQQPAAQLTATLPPTTTVAKEGDAPETTKTPEQIQKASSQPSEPPSPNVSVENLNQEREPLKSSSSEVSMPSGSEGTPVSSPEKLVSSSERLVSSSEGLASSSEKEKVEIRVEEVVTDEAATELEGEV